MGRMRAPPRVMVWLGTEKKQGSKRRRVISAGHIRDFDYLLKTMERLAQGRLLARGDLSFVKIFLAAQWRKV